MENVRSALLRCAGRLLTSTSLRKLAPWIQAWAHTDLCGGLPGDRRADTLHARLSRDLAVGEPGFRNAVLGSKQGLAKCFDNTCHVQAISILAKLGLPCKLVKILFHFFAENIIQADAPTARRCIRRDELPFEGTIRPSLPFCFNVTERAFWKLSLAC